MTEKVKIEPDYLRDRLEDEKLEMAFNAGIKFIEYVHGISFMPSPNFKQWLSKQQKEKSV